MEADPARIELSIVVVVYDMAREAPRTLLSLSPDHQGVDASRYEVVVVDNGSKVPLSDAQLAVGGPNVRYHRIEPSVASPSPASAVNAGVAIASGDLVGVVVDGARMASPGLVDMALGASRLDDDVVVTTLAWHLGPDTQPRSVPGGYDQEVEDRLLDGIGWPVDGYRLFDIATVAPASARGPLFALPECSAVFMRRSAFMAIGGFDERFDQPAGGLAANDFFVRLVSRPGVVPVMLVGEGTFHQVHGPVGTYDHEAMNARYEQIRGSRFETPIYRPILFGYPSPAAAKILARSAVMLARSAQVATDELLGRTL